jgi:flagellin-like hook-associated protein FlgL
MKDTVKERLINLATAQEVMADTADQITKWDETQLVLEKSAFDSLNVSDNVLKYSQECSALVARLLECCHTVVKSPDSYQQKKMLTVLEEIHEDFNKINEASSNLSDISHRIESQVTLQREIEEGIKKSLCQLSDCIDTAAASTELIIADF